LAPPAPGCIGPRHAKVGGPVSPFLPAAVAVGAELTPSRHRFGTLSRPRFHISAGAI
jgi:hypothetical protein